MHFCSIVLVCALRTNGVINRLLFVLRRLPIYVFDIELRNLVALQRATTIDKLIGLSKRSLHPRTLVALKLPSSIWRDYPSQCIYFTPIR